MNRPYIFLRALHGRGTLRVPDIGREVPPMAGRPYNPNHPFADFLRVCQYLNAKQTEELTGELTQVGRMLNSMIDKAHLFCGQRNFMIRDETMEYLANIDD